LVPVPGSISEKELQTLWEAGVDGVAVDARAESGAEKLEKIRRTIGGLTYPSAKRPEKASAIAPRVSLKEPEPEEEEEDE